MSTDQSWCTIESDPGVFTELINQIGVQGCTVEEIYTLDEDTLSQLKPVYGLIFLFKWRQEEDNRPVDENAPIFFANQVIPNACATQAILSILLNRDEIDIGEELKKFKEFAGSLPPDVRGMAISNSDLIRTVHNSFARPEPFLFVSSKTDEDDSDVYHFISYLPRDGNLFELDGLKGGPINLGPCTMENWLDKVCPVIQKRIDRYSQSEIRFNLMAVIKDHKLMYTEDLEKAQKRKAEIEASRTSDGNQMETDELQVIEAEINTLKEKVNAEEDKRKRWKVDNIRRRHNYIPFIMNTLKILAERGELLPLLEKAKQKTSEKKSRQKENKKTGD